MNIELTPEVEVSDAQKDFEAASAQQPTPEQIKQFRAQRKQAAEQAKAEIAALKPHVELQELHARYAIAKLNEAAAWEKLAQFNMERQGPPQQEETPAPDQDSQTSPESES